MDEADEEEDEQISVNDVPFIASRDFLLKYGKNFDLHLDDAGQVILAALDCLSAARTGQGTDLLLTGTSENRIFREHPVWFSYEKTVPFKSFRRKPLEGNCLFLGRESLESVRSF